MKEIIKDTLKYLLNILGYIVLLCIYYYGLWRVKEEHSFEHSVILGIALIIIHIGVFTDSIKKQIRE